MQAYPTRNPSASTSAASDAFRPDLEDGTLIEDYSSGDYTCGQCGLVLGGRIVDTRSEWRTFADSEGDDPSRVGGPGDPLLDGSSQLSSVISFKDNNTGTARSLQRAAATVATKTGEKTLVDAFHDIQDLCDHIALPKTVADSAKALFKRQAEEKIFSKVRNLKAIIAACIFVGCREQRVERSFKEIVALSGVPKTEVAHCFSKISQTFGVASANVIESSAAAIVMRFCSQLGLPPAIQSAAGEVVRKMDEHGDLAGRSPISIASACLYFTSHAFGVGKSVKEIAAVASISDTTVRTAYR
ncbi:transcription initiation factor IIB [Cystobasidiomycetes sp. EMM_F5]